MESELLQTNHSRGKRALRKVLRPMVEQLQALSAGELEAAMAALVLAPQGSEDWWVAAARKPVAEHLAELIQAVDPEAWHPWAHGECPVRPNTLVEVELATSTRGVGTGKRWRWEWSTPEGPPQGGDIVRWRLVR